MLEKLVTVFKMKQSSPYHAIRDLPGMDATRKRALRGRRTSPAVYALACITGSACARAHRRRFMRTHAAYAHAHRRRFMRTSAAPITTHACIHVGGGGFVAAYLARLADLQCSRSLRGRGASADGSSACGPARGPWRLDWWFRHGSSPSTIHLRPK